jgi:HK97 family phage major capsid protein
MSFKLKGLRERRGEIKTKIEAIGTRIRTESRAMSADERAAFDQLKVEWQKVNEDIRSTEAAMENLDSLVSGGGEGTQENSQYIPGLEDRSHVPRPGAGGSDYARAFQGWALHARGQRVPNSNRSAAERIGVSLGAKEFLWRFGPHGLAQKRALSTTPAAGGYTIAQDFSNQLEVALSAYGGVREVADVMVTDTGADMPWPTEDDTSNTGARIDEGAEVVFADDTFSTVNFGAYKYTSKGILLSNELLNDSAFNLETHLGQQCGIRIGRAQGADFTTGTGTNQPQGVVTGASTGITTATAGAILPSELTRLAHAVDPAYRIGPSVGYMMHDSTLAYLMTLTVGASDGRRLITESWQDGASSLRLNGFPIFINQHMAAPSGVAGIPATGQKLVLFGDFSKYKIRDVGEVRFRKLEERYAEKDQTAFIAFLRSDGRYTNTAAVKVLLQA